MISLADMADQTGAANYGDLWAKIVGPSTKWIADSSIFLLCFGCCVFYSCFIGDIFGALSSAVGIQGWIGKRSVILGILSTFVLLPLCLIEDLSALQFSSVLGVAGVLYTVVMHFIRYLDGSYKTGGSLTSSSATEVVKAAYSALTVNKGTLVLVNMLCVGFLAHYNAISYFKELKHSTLPNYTKAVSVGFGVAGAVFLTMMFLGFELFGLSAQPLVLNNFHRTKDLLASVARAATGMAIVFAYPLMFAGLKSSLASLAPTASKAKKELAATTVLGLITTIAVNCGEEDVSVVLGIVGSVLGCGAAYVIPGALRLGLFRQQSKAGLPKPNKLSVLVNHLLVVFGCVFAVLGVWITLSSAGHH